MPKRRRKRSTKTKSVKDIPYTKYRDEGWVYEKTKNYIKLFASYDKDEEGITFGDRIAIPRSWVIKMTKI
jgi:hypothetical protein